LSLPLSIADLNDETCKLKVKDFEQSIKDTFGNRAQGIAVEDDDTTPEYEPYQDDSSTLEPIIVPDEYDLDEVNRYISARVLIPHGGQIVSGKVLKRKRDEDGNLIGKSNTNPRLDTSIHEVELDDGHIESYGANLIAENIYEQVDSEDEIHRLIDEITDHERLGDAVQPDDAIDKHGKPRETTKGWRRLATMKDGYPVETAEYAVSNKLLSQPAFSWWVPRTLKVRERILSKVNTRYLRKDEKYGIQMPKSVNDALQLDRDSGTTYWSKAIKKEMLVILPAVRILNSGDKPPVGYQYVPCHMVFDVKVDFSRKARYVGGGHVTKPPATQTYASVVSRDSVRIAFMYSTLNELEVLSADVQGAYLNAPCKERVYTICGAEFGPENIGRVAVIEKALYGLRTSAFAWREHLSTTLEKSLGFSPCVADNDVWMRPATKNDGSEYYELVLVHTDDLLVVSHQAQSILTQLDQHYVLKPGSIGPPKVYLGVEVGHYVLDDDPTKNRWYLSSDKYVKEAIRNVREWLHNRNRELKYKAPSVIPAGYRPELDVTTYCNEEESNYFQQQIGVLRWMVELGRIDIAVEVSMLASFTAAPRLGHMDALLHVFVYLSQHSRSKLVLDDSYVPLVEQEKQDWSSFYPEVVEQLPPNMPPPRGKPMQMIVFADADHAGDQVSRRSRTGILLYLNWAPIIWYTKKQNLVETSTFGSEFMAAKAAVELIKGMRYKLRMLGIPLDGPAQLKMDNMSVVLNTSAPESTLKKKSNARAYHFVRECVAANIVEISFETSKTNKGDILTKPHTGPERQRLISSILY
jgi:Reverse transcriptase (RNA-dependent DNA polymerase)